MQGAAYESVGAILIRCAPRRARICGVHAYDQGPTAVRVRRVDPGAIRVQLPDTRQQEDYTCGASCFQSIAAYFGVLDASCEESDLVRVMGIQSDVGAHP